MAIKLFLTHRRRRRRRRRRPYGRPTKERVVVGWNSTVVSREEGCWLLALSFFLPQSHRLENYPFPLFYFFYWNDPRAADVCERISARSKSYFAASKAGFFSSV